MKLFLILYTAGQIGGFAGPVPYDMKECERRADQMRSEVAMIIATGKSTNGKNEDVPEDDIERFKTWKVSCEFREVAPKLGEKEASL